MYCTSSQGNTYVMNHFHLHRKHLYIFNHEHLEKSTASLLPPFSFLMPIPPYLNGHGFVLLFTTFLKHHLEAQKVIPSSDSFIKNQFLRLSTPLKPLNSFLITISSYSHVDKEYLSMTDCFIGSAFG